VLVDQRLSLLQNVKWNDKRPVLEHFRRTHPNKLRYICWENCRANYCSQANNASC